MYKNGEISSKGPENEYAFSFDEKAGRIVLKTAEGYQDRIFKIQSKGPDPVNEDCTIYITQMPTTNGNGLAVVIIVVDKFYKVIKLGSYTGNENGLRNYIEYQYE